MGLHFWVRNGAPLLGEEWGSTFWSGMGLHFWVRNGASLFGQEWGYSFCMGIQGMGLHFLYGNSRNGAPLSGADRVRNGAPLLTWSRSIQAGQSGTTNIF